MTVVALDTLAVVKELKAAGFTEEQAEAVTRVVRKAQDIDLSDLATKSDIEALRFATKSDIAVLKADIEALRSGTKADLQVGLSEMRTDLQRTRTDILKWIIGTIGLQTVAVLGTVIALAPLLPR